MKFITLGHRTVELKERNGAEFLKALNELILKVSRETSPMNSDYISGDVSLERNSFVLYPFKTWNRIFYLTTDGIVTKNQSGKYVLHLTFKASILQLAMIIAFVVFYLSYLTIFSPNMGALFFFIPIVVVIYPIRFLLARWEYKKDRSKIIKFLGQFEKDS